MRPNDHFVWLALNAPGIFRSIAAKLPDLINEDLTLTPAGIAERERLNDAKHRDAIHRNVIAPMTPGQRTFLFKLYDDEPYTTADLRDCNLIGLAGAVRRTREGWEITPQGRALVDMMRLT